MTAGLEVDAAAGLTVQLGRIADSMQQSVQAGLRNAEDITRFVKIPGVQATLSSSGNGTLDLGGPGTGYEWTVRRVTASDAIAWSTSMTGQVVIYAGQPSGGLITPNNAEWGMPNLPNVAMFGSDQLVVQYGEHLLVQFIGANDAQVVQASAAYQLYRAGSGRTVAPL
jgi:hypothetical protein